MGGPVRWLDRITMSFEKGSVDEVEAVLEIFGVCEKAVDITIRSSQ
jgi:hypothetical protein